MTDKITSQITKSRGPRVGAAMAHRGDDWRDTATEWTVVLVFQGRQMSLNYYTGSGVKEAPTTASVVNNLALDAHGATYSETFEEWAAEFGYDEDSRKAERIYNACKLQAKRLGVLLMQKYSFEELTDEDRCIEVCE